MSKSKSRPKFDAIIITYEDLSRYAHAFSNGHLNLLFVVGSPGIGKSQTIRRIVGNTACWIDGNATAFGIYCHAYEYRDRPIVLDDVDGLYRLPAGVRLLKALCQSDPIKSVSWQSDAKTLQSRGIPQRYTTSSRVVIIANEWKSLNSNVVALEDRGHRILFEPSAPEVHRETAKWFWDQEIYEFVGGVLHLLSSPSMRIYVLAWELKWADLDWRTFVLSHCVSGTALAVAKLKFNAIFETEEDRARKFVSSGAGCRATYFNHVRRLFPAEPVTQLILKNSPPSTSEMPAAGI